MGTVNSNSAPAARASPRSAAIVFVLSWAALYALVVTLVGWSGVQWRPHIPLGEGWFWLREVWTHPIGLGLTLMLLAAAAAPGLEGMTARSEAILVYRAATVQAGLLAAWLCGDYAVHSDLRPACSCPGHAGLLRGPLSSTVGVLYGSPHGAAALQSAAMVLGTILALAWLVGGAALLLAPPDVRARREVTRFAAAATPWVLLVAPIAWWLAPALPRPLRDLLWVPPRLAVALGAALQVSLALGYVRARAWRARRDALRDEEEGPASDSSVVT